MLTGVYRYPRADGVLFGTPWEEALRTEVDRIDAHKVLAIVSGSLRAAMPLEAGLRGALGECFAGIFHGIRAHSPRDDVAQAAAAARVAGADLLVAIGGGSVIDAAKVAQLCLEHEVFSAPGFDAFGGKRGASGSCARQPPRRCPLVIGGTYIVAMPPI